MRLVALLAILLPLCLANHVCAQSREAPALNVVRAPGAERCVDPGALMQRVEELTGPVFVPSSATSFVMEVELAPSGSGFRAVIAVAGRGVDRHTRVLEEPSSDCHKLDAPLVFILALTVDPRLSLSTLPAELQALLGQELAPEEALLAELNASPPVAAEVALEDDEAPPGGAANADAPPQAPARRRQLHYALSAGAALSLFTLPRSQWGFGVSLASDLSRWFWLALGFRAHPVAEVVQANGGRLALRSYALSLLACPLYGRLGSVFAQACAGPTLEIVSGRGRGFERDYRAMLWIPSLAAAVSARLPLFWKLGLSAELQGRVGLASGRFVSRTTNASSGGHTRPRRWGLAVVFGAYVEF